ncbi:MAG: hypothetical protein ACJ77E_07165 [Gaiellaceae bacterium]
MRTLVRRLFILVAVGVVSGLLAYAVNGRGSSAASSTAGVSQAQPAAPAPPPARPDLDQLESCLRAQGATVPFDPRDDAFRAALLACRHSLPVLPFDHRRGFGPDDDGPR